MKRREFITLFGGAAGTWPLAARAQQTAMPKVGFLRSTTAEGSALLVAAFRQGLQEAGYVESQNVAIEYRWAEGKPDRLPALAADLVRRNVAVILASASDGARAAKDATSTIPIVFVTALDPVQFGLVASLNRPGGNATGMTYLSSALGAKRLELLNEIAPTAKLVGVFVTNNPTTEPFLHDTKVGAAALGLQLLITTVASGEEIESMFAKLAAQRPGALVIGPDPIFTAHRSQIAALAARYKLPSISTTREFAKAGGLMTWGVNLADQYRLAGTYVGKILKGAKPADLPVLEPDKFELVINLRAAKALRIAVPPQLLALADEVIE